MTGTAPPLLVTHRGAVTQAMLNRPARRNALDAATFEALEDLLASLRAPGSSSRILVLGGAGGHFCAGLDLAEMAATPGDAAAREAAQRARNQRMGALLAGLKALPQVVVAVVQGAAQAGGIGLVCAADIALADASARFAAPEVRRGLVAAQILPWMARRMGHAVTTRLVLQGHALDATAALAAGLVHAAAEDATGLDRLLQATLDDLVLAAPAALAETKTLLAALGPLAPEPYGAMALEAFTRCAAGPEAVEGIAAFREKRLPRWAG